MENFIVSARKYRPQNFSTVVGQSHITTTLRNAIIQKHLAHAFLFCGPRGVGKTTCARILAKTINCIDKSADGEACNACTSCVSFENGSSLNIHELDAASNNSVDDIRSLVEQVRFAPQAGDYKVYIIDEVHMLSSSAFNAFLKTLEEPPSYAIFILATTEKHKILPTILSRCQIFDFKRIRTSDTVEHLQEICSKESIEAEEAALHVIAQKSEGCMRDALSILDKIVSFTNSKITYDNTLEHLNILDEGYFFKLQDHFDKQELSDALLLFDDILQKGFEGDTFLEGYAEFVRNLLVSTDPKAVQLLDVPEEFKKKYMEVAQMVQKNWMLSALQLISQGDIDYKLARNKRLFIELLLIKLSYLNQALEIAVADTGVDVKKKLDKVQVVNFRALPIVAYPQENKIAEPIETVAAEPKPSLHIEEAVAERQPAKEGNKVVENPETVQPTTVAVDTKTKVAGSVTLSSLSKLQQKIAAENNIQSPPIALTKSLLQKAVGDYITKLNEDGNDLGAANISRGKLDIKDENNFTITAIGKISESFIIAERAGFIDFLQERFNNKTLKYEVLVEIVDNKEDGEEEKGNKLTKKEQAAIMLRKHPNILKIKDALKMVID